MYCYRKAQISFSNVKSLFWTDKNSQYSTDASGEIDFGNIDEFFLVDGIYKIFSGLGDFEIISDKPKLEIY